MEISQNKLSNGIRTIYIQDRSFRLAALKLFIKVGSQDDGELLGITHFLEHMLFNNENKNRKVFYEVERYGGIINANTTKEYMSIYIVIEKDKLFQVLPIILDLVFDINITIESIKREKQIILQEILMSQNSTGAMWDLFSSYYWEINPLRNPIRGYIETINKIGYEELINHYRRNVHPDNVVVSCTSGLEKEDYIGFLEDYFSKYTFGRTDRPVNPCNEIITPERIVVDRNMQLVHMFRGYSISGMNGDDYYSLKGLSKLLGEGGFSRLYQVLREKEKLVYSVEVKQLSYAHTGVFLIYTKCRKEDLTKVESLIDSEISRLRSEQIDKQDLQFLKSSYSGSLYRNFETALSICSILGIEKILTDDIVKFQDSINNFNTVTSNQLTMTASKYLDKSKTILIGKV